MKTKFVKAALYSYPNLNTLIHNFNQRITNTALKSNNDYRPVDVIWDDMCEKLVFKKVELMKFKEAMCKCVSTFTEKERYRADLKYFNRAWELDYGRVSDTSILEKTAKFLEANGFGNSWFNSVGKEVLINYLVIAKRSAQPEDRKSPHIGGPAHVSGW